MNTQTFGFLFFLCSLPAGVMTFAASPALDERPAGPGEWGYRPADGALSETNPPAFSWRPQPGIVAWELEYATGRSFKRIEYAARGIEFNVHCPSRTSPPGTYFWRYRGVDDRGHTTPWSRVRAFALSDDSAPMPMPPREELLRRVPTTHPRLFLRPDAVSRFRELARGALRDQFRKLENECERLLANPPPTTEPEKYPAGMVRGSPEWRKLWWGNRVYTTAALNGAATLGFAHLLGAKKEYGQLAKRLLLECARWDPRGATGYRYNDEAGMPYAYYFSRAYTFIHDVLTEEERERCRRVMRIRGEEMYRHLCPRHLWRPYSSHSNRAWHFLGEVGIAFLGEIEAAADWVWFSMNVFFNVYPVWSDADGGWHEGVSYWSSYIGRFTWWADIMREALGINAYDKPYFSRAGYYSMYLMPPGKVGGGFGDGANRRRASQLVPLMSQLAAQAGNGHWQWYVEQMGGPRSPSGYVGFIRGALSKVAPTPPDNLPVSKLFRGTGQAYLNTTLRSARDNVQVIFKSSPMGTWSHGNAANNSFILSAYGERLLTRTGHYYNYGGPHHRGWVWSTRSLNNITVNGLGQLKRSAAALGDITAFAAGETIDGVIGEAGKAYHLKETDASSTRTLNRFTRAVLFVKPELVVVYDRIAARSASTFEYWLHSTKEFTIHNQRKLQVQVGDVLCDIDVLAPEGLTWSQTDQYDPNPEPRIKTRDWHVTLKTPSKSTACEFIAIYRPHLRSQAVPRKAELVRIDGGYRLAADLSDGRVVALLPTDDAATLSESQSGGLTAPPGAIALGRWRTDGTVVERLNIGGSGALGGGTATTLRHSEVVFMYASTPEAYQAYGASFVGWGGANTRERVAMHRGLGIRSTGSVWCLTAGAKTLHADERLREAVAVDIEGKPIPVPWQFDKVHEGQTTDFGNTNHPAFREHVKANVRRVMAGGADGLHVDDHLGVASPAHWYGGGFDDYSIAGFRAYLKAHATAKDLANAGVNELDTFDYRVLVRKFARTAEEVKRQAGRIPLFDMWKRYHLETAADFVEELRQVAEEAAGHPVLLSANACLGNDVHHHVVPRLTHVICEVWFDAHRGTASLHGALKAYNAAKRLDRPLACTASGHDWAHVKAKGVHELVRFWIALTYAHGQRFMVPHPTRQWCFNRELGTHWYQAPIEEFAPLYQFIRKNAAVFDGYEAADDVRLTTRPGLIAKMRQRGASLAIHCVNLDYDAERDRMREVKDVRIGFPKSRIAGRREARLLSADAETVRVPVQVEGEEAFVTLPTLRLWGIVVID